MTNIPQLTGPSFGPANGGDPKQLVILLHGLGADGNDLINLAPYFAQALPDARFLSPDAPFRCDMAPPGFNAGYQWFSLQDRAPQAMLDGARSARPIIDAFIDQQLENHGLAPKQLALVGFSQGTMMSLFTGLRRPTEIAGILGYSGLLLGSDVLAEEITARPPVTLINGDTDDLIPIETQAPAVDTLKAVHVPVEAHVRPGLGHGIDPEGIGIGCAFLAQIFGG